MVLLDQSTGSRKRVRYTRKMKHGYYKNQQINLLIYIIK